VLMEKKLYYSHTSPHIGKQQTIHQSKLIIKKIPGLGGGVLLLPWGGILALPLHGCNNGTGHGES